MDPSPAPGPPPAPSGPDTFTTAAELARLLDTLHESGALRVLNGLLAQVQDVSAAAALDGLGTDEAQNGLANLLVLAKTFGRLDADGVDRFVSALVHAVSVAGQRLEAKDKAPGTLAVLTKLRRPDVRRGLDATLTLLGALGSQLHDPRPAARPGGYAGGHVGGQST